MQCSSDLGEEALTLSQFVGLVKYDTWTCRLCAQGNCTKKGDFFCHGNQSDDLHGTFLSWKVWVLESSESLRLRSSFPFLGVDSEVPVAVPGGLEAAAEVEDQIRAPALSA